MKIPHKKVTLSTAASYKTFVKMQMSIDTFKKCSLTVQINTDGRTGGGIGFMQIFILIFY
jgi:hypothetical protein